MKKANPTIVGYLGCSTCGDTMEVRQRSNGKKLLYTYCPNCKMDQRSGNAIQDVWRESMVASPELLLKAEPELEVEVHQDNTDHQIDHEEWSPTDEFTETQADEETESTSFVGWLFGGLFVAGCFLIGLKAS